MHTLASQEKTNDGASFVSAYTINKAGNMETTHCSYVY